MEKTADGLYMADEQQRNLFRVTGSGRGVVATGHGFQSESESRSNKSLS